MPVAEFTICGVKIHTFAKIKILCNATADREKDPRKMAIHGLKEVRPPAAEDLHHQEEASAEAQARTGVPAVHLIKMATAIHAPAGHLKTTREGNVPPVNPMEEVATANVQPVGHTTGAAMANVPPVNPTIEVVTANAQPVVHSTGAVMANVPPVNPTKEEVTANVQPVVHSIGAVTANALLVNLTKEGMMKNAPPAVRTTGEENAGVTTASLLKRTIPAANPDLQARMAVCV